MLLGPLVASFVTGAVNTAEIAVERERLVGNGWNLFRNRWRRIKTGFMDGCTTPKPQKAKQCEKFELEPEQGSNHLK